jgi:hypothetical protein
LQTPDAFAWLKTIPVKELIERGRISGSADRATLLEQVLRFFGVASVDAWKAGWEKPQFAFRKSPTFEGQTGAMATWLRLCELAAAEIACKPFNKKKFQAALQQIRALTVAEPEAFVPAMQALCREAGVAVALVPEIKGAPVSGAAKWLSPRKAMIGLTLRGKSDDRFWFSFFHEAGHLLHDSKKETYIDVHPVDDPRERRANQFAASFLIPPARVGELADLQTDADVEAFARELGIAPGIVVGRLQHDRIIPFSKWNGTMCSTLSGSGQYFSCEKQYSQQRKARSRTVLRVARLIARVVILIRGTQTKLVDDRVERNLPPFGKFHGRCDSPCVIGFDFVVQRHHFRLLICIQSSRFAESFQFSPPLPDSRARHFHRLLQPLCLFLGQCLGNDRFRGEMISHQIRDDRFWGISNSGSAFTDALLQRRG